MSYSLSLTRARPADLPEQVDAKIDELLDGPGKDEARKHRIVLQDALTILTEHIDGDVTGSVSGSASATSGYLSISVNAAPAEVPATD